MQVQLISNGLTVTVNHQGAEVCSVKNKSGLEFIWQAEKQVWPRHAPVLFPIVGKLKNNRFIHEGKPYELGQHGFARDREFRLLSRTDSECVFELAADDDSKQHYPFDFIFRIRYFLKGNTLVTDYTVTNPSGTTIIFSVGAHPGFICPLLPDERMEDYYLEFEHADLYTTGLANGLRTDERRKPVMSDNRLPLTPGLFDNDALVFEDSQIHSVSLRSSASACAISLRCDNWPYFGIWSKPGAGFVCLEPWYGIADRTDASGNLAEKQGCMSLSPGESFDCRFSLTFAS